MAEIYFRCSENEFLAFTKHIFSRGCYLVSGVFRVTPDLICIHNFDEMIQYYKDFCKYIRKTTKVIRYHNCRVYCGLEYIRQVIMEL